MATTPFSIPRQIRESTVLTGNGTVGPYGPSLFKVFDLADVRVYQRPAGVDLWQDVTGLVTLAKTANQAFDTFSVTFPATVPNTTQMIFRSERVAERSVAVTRAGTVDSAQLEKELSKQATVQQELRRDIGRAFKADYGQTGGRVIIGGDGHVPIFDAAGNLIEGPAAADVAGAQGAATAALGALADFRENYLGPHIDDAAAIAWAAANGVAVSEGATYFNTADAVMKVWDGAAWSVVTPFGLLDQANFAANDAAKAASQRSVAQGKLQKAATIAALAALPFVVHDAAAIAEAGRAGNFLKLAGNQSALVAADPQQGIVVAPASDPTGASGVWQRVDADAIKPAWVGAIGDGLINDRTALAAADALAQALGVPLLLAKGTYLINSPLTINSQIVSRGGKLKPAAGVTVTLAKSPPLEMVQLFDMAAGGKIALAKKVAMPEWFHSSTNLSNSMPHAIEAVGANGRINLSQAYTQTSPFTIAYQGQRWEGTSKRFVSVTAVGNISQVVNGLAGATLTSHTQIRHISWICDPTCNVPQFDLEDAAFVVMDECSALGSTLLGNFGAKFHSASNTRPPIYQRIFNCTFTDHGSAAIYMGTYTNSAVIFATRIQPGRAGVYGIDMDPAAGQYLDDGLVLGCSIERGGALSQLTNGIRCGSLTSGQVQSIVIIGNRFEQLLNAINVAANSWLEGSGNRNYFGSCVNRVVSTGGGVVSEIQASGGATVAGGVLTILAQPRGGNIDPGTGFQRVSAGRFKMFYQRAQGRLLPHIQVVHGADTTTVFTVKVLVFETTHCEFVFQVNGVATDPEGFFVICHGMRV